MPIIMYLINNENLTRTFMQKEKYVNSFKEAEVKCFI